MNSDSTRKSLMLAWFVWGLAAAYYFSDYMARVAPGVMHGDLQQAFGMNEAGFGLLSYSFYVPYILMQIPVGLLIDRISIRSLLSTMSLVTALGCLFFGFSNSLLIAAFARVLIGFSAAFAFIAALRLATAWFPPYMLGLLAGLTQALGMLGAASGEAPIAFLVQHVGWRSCMFWLSLLFVILALLLFFFIKDHESMKLHRSNKTFQLSIGESLKIILKQKQIWINALYAGCLFGPIAVIGESFGPAYLEFGWGLSAQTAASAIGFIFIGWGIGGPFFGWLSDKSLSRKKWMIFSSVCTLIFSVWIVYFPIQSTLWVNLLFLMLGFTNNGVSLAYATATEMVDRKVIASAIAFTNMASIFVGASLQPLLGYWIDKIAGVRSFQVSYLTLADFQKPMILLVVSAMLALLLSFFIRETNCKNIHDE